MSLFFGFEIHAPWPDEYPKGRLLAPEMRHLTLAFLGKEGSVPAIETTPRPPFKVGITGVFREVLFLPPTHPHVVAWQIHWNERESDLLIYQKELAAAMHIQDNRPFLSHVTIARDPHEMNVWKKSFAPLPLYMHHFHLYRSLGHSEYQSLWSYPLLAPFEEIEHTADIAYLIRAEKKEELFGHAQCALAFRCPQLLPFLTPHAGLTTVETIVSALNQQIAIADATVGIPLKAVSLHGEIRQRELFEWVMIVDV